MGKEESESKFGFKNKEKADETIKLLAEHDLQYQKLTVRGLLGRAKRVLTSKCSFVKYKLYPAWSVPPGTDFRMKLLQI